jgi:SAM-dependent methyltransferase
VTSRQRSQVFGEVAADYDAVRAAYAPELVDTVVSFAGRHPRTAVEVGAGTGLATQAFARLGVPITCIEPDPEMAAVLAGKFATDEHIEVVIGRFEDWRAPDGGVDLIYCAQAWHWVDPATRFQLAHDALADGGVLALCGHRYEFADEDMFDAISDVYRDVAPSLMEQITPAPNSGIRWDWSEVEASGLWSGTATAEFIRLEPYPTAKYLTLMTTFSEHRMLPPDVLAEVRSRVAEVIDARGGVVTHRLLTWLEMARRGG